MEEVSFLWPADIGSGRGRILRVHLATQQAVRVVCGRHQDIHIIVLDALHKVLCILARHRTREIAGGQVARLQQPVHWLHTTHMPSPQNKKNKCART